MLEINNLSIKFLDNQKQVVENFNLNLEEGEIVSIVGESGSGKTSVIRAIFGLLKTGAIVSSGDIRFMGRSILSLSNKEFREFRGRDVAMIFQDSSSMLNPIRSIGSQYIDYIRLHKDMSKSEAHKLACEMLLKMRLTEPANVLKSYPFQLSGGMKQRVGIAMAMTFQPKLLLADEPTSALDVTTQAQMVRLMLELRRDFGTAILIVTHDIGLAAYIGDKMLVMKDGITVDYGNRDEILKNSKSRYTMDLLASVPSLEGGAYV